MVCTPELEPLQGSQESLEVAQAQPADLVEILKTVTTGVEFPEVMKGRYIDDAFFRQVILKPTHYKDFILRDGLIFMKLGDAELLCIPNIVVDGVNIRRLVIEQAHSLLAHLGSRKTLNYLRENVWWDKMIRDVATFCESCPICAMSKPSTQKPAGLLRTLEVPRRPWQSIGIDFVGPLPASSNRHGSFDMICVIIDHLTSMVHLVPTKQTYKAKDIAELIFDVVYKAYGLPEVIVSDRDSLFMSTFWQTLHKLINTELRLSSAYHPQTDGATERANRTMT
jgi:hypothetical protein